MTDTDLDRIVAGMTEAQKRAMERGRRYIRRVWQAPKTTVRARLEAEHG